MIRLAYFSSVAPGRPPVDREAILTTSRRNNLRLGITGMLIHRRGNFLQILEGPKDSVLQVYDSIQNDRRHTGVTEIFLEPATSRDFSAWSMGFHDLDAPGARIDGYDRFLQEHFDLGALQPTSAVALFKLFKPGLARDAALSGGHPAGAP